MYQILYDVSLLLDIFIVSRVFFPYYIALNSWVASLYKMKNIESKVLNMFKVVSTFLKLFSRKFPIYTPVSSYEELPGASPVCSTREGLSLIRLFWLSVRFHLSSSVS